MKNFIKKIQKYFFSILFIYKKTSFFNKNALIGAHKLANIIVKKNTLQFGANWYIKDTFSSLLVIHDKISILENITIRDSNNHTIVYKGVNSIETQFIKVGRHFWIGINVTISKNNVIMAVGSVVNKTFPNNVLISCVSIKTIKANVQ